MFCETPKVYRGAGIVVLFSMLFGAASVCRGDGLELCNRAPQEIWAAAAYLLDGNWSSEGWWHLKPGACTQVLSGDLQTGNQFYYVYAENTAQQTFWRGEHFFCVDNSKAFNVQGYQDCFRRGYAQRGFTQVDIQDATAFTWEFRGSNSTAPPR